MTQTMLKREGIRLTPFLKWAGGKRWLVANHPDVFPATFNRYIEPFLGSGAVYFHLSPSISILSDVNSELITTYRVIRDDWIELQKQLNILQSRHSDEYFYVVRSWTPIHPIEKAARFIYLNRTCWNGLYRVNRRGEFNVPRGSKDAVLLDTDDFSEIARRLKKASLHVADFEKTIDLADEGDLLFVDPPYTVKHNLNGFVKYNDKIFLWEDQVRLRDAIVRATQRGVFLVMTNANHESIRGLYRGFSKKLLSRHSVLSGSAEGRGPTEELLVTNFRLR